LLYFYCVDNFVDGPNGRDRFDESGRNGRVTAAQLASLMIVASGAAHAAVNAVLKAGRDKLSGRALIDGFSALLVLPFVFFLPPPTGAWGWLTASWAVHLVYLVCLVKAFESADMTVAYPVARGVAPALAAAGAVWLFGEPISARVAGGIGLVTVGVLTVGLGRDGRARGLGWAAATGVTIALYTVIDAQGVRASPTAASYIAWMFVFLGFGVAALFALWRGPAFVAAARSEWKPGLAAGALSIVTYGLALWAYRLGDTPRLAALRETSILFAVAIAVVFLKERPTWPRLLGVAGIAAGAMVLLVGG
jgi:drug/metabolite transporter (DMT)-like permease